MNIGSSFRATLAALALVLAVPSTYAYVLHKADQCKPGQKWDVSRPVKVRLLADSFFDYEANRTRTGQGLADIVRIDRDLKAVIALYNAIPGTRLKLEQDTGITGDSNLSGPDTENFGTQTIVIGFTRDTPTKANTEAWTSLDPAEGCTRTRAHILFEKTYDWIYGPPDSLQFGLNQFARSFYTADQPAPKPADGLARTFLGILTHEMGHAVGLEHPLEGYAIMDQRFRTWFRGENALVTGLLPDDTAGILALYGAVGATKPLDVSLSASWAKSVRDQCPGQAAALDAAQQAYDASSGTGLPTRADLFKKLATAQADFDACGKGKVADQIVNCSVSSRGDDWTDPLSEAASCGLNDPVSPARRPVSSLVCPGAQVQVRYTVNNNTTAREALVKTEAWFTKGTTLNTLDGSALQSPDVREVTIQAASSRLVGHVFKLPADAKSGDTFQVFVRGIPYDPVTGASLYDSDVDQWNNAIMVGGSITVAATAGC